MAVVKFQEGVPVPPPRSGKPGRKPKYAFDRLRVGDSMVVETENPEEVRQTYWSVRAWNKRHPETRLEWRRVEKGIGVWRTK